ncbi:MAG: hypothetical protein ACJ77A_18000 [Actinomycetota bacterium]
MAYEPVDEDPVVHTPHVHHEERGHSHRPVAPAPPPTPAHDPTSGWTAYAAVKYGFMLLITIVILYFLARFVIPLFT